ncbi:MAG: lipoprotein [Prevotella sp.]|nr:lipoprotein [Prevotella sp.]
MKRTFFFIATALVVLTACQQKNENDEANALLAEIETLYETGQYRTALDSIESLRRRFPTSVEARRKGLRLWQEASLKMAQADIAVTDSALQATTAQMQAEQRIYERNMLGVKKDSLQARYEALIGVVRMIRKRMDEIHK